MPCEGSRRMCPTLYHSSICLQPPSTSRLLYTSVLYPENYSGKWKSFSAKTHFGIAEPTEHSTASGTNTYDGALNNKVQSNYIELIKSIYTSRRPVLNYNQQENHFLLKRAYAKAILSPLTLFNAVLEYFFRQLNWDHLGLNINGARLNHLRFADDLVLREENPAAKEQIMQSLANISREVGLEINASKTKLMSNSREIDVMVDGNKIEYVKEYIYLGQIISRSDETTKEINRRIAQGWRKYWSLKEITSKNGDGLDICYATPLTNGATLWQPRDGKRGRGRQVRRWEDDLKLAAGPFWLRVARDRIHWKELEEAYAKRHTELRDLL
ncbi:unnamed protein product [Pieris macdunnoughi]|uniref:Reverse transcriptase domain-containing protein n=1 Tax=Pieris macdunnoughi TaxID=345717 RepID=A0A821PPI3_9NEOP|nr:unnamed protein product [Pieris macdunnoughi]